MSLAYQIAMIVLGIITMIIAIITSSRIRSYNGAIIDFRDNWNLRSILDIKTALSQWPPGYEDLISSSWSGTKAGCDCSHSFTYFYSSIKIGACDSNHTSSGWRTITPTNAIPINKFYSYRICARRAGNSFVNIARPIRESDVSQNQCKFGYKLWGTGGRDYSVWVHESEEWPINHIYIAALSDPSQAPAGYKAQPLDGGQLFPGKSRPTRPGGGRVFLTKKILPATLFHTYNINYFVLKNIKNNYFKDIFDIYHKDFSFNMWSLLCLLTIFTL